ncbi:MAG: thioredoxin domain-containing protein [Sphingomonadales bacterium]
MTRMMIAGVAALALTACNATGNNSSTTAAAPVAGKAAPAGTEWATTVVATPEGGFRMGNPDAPIKLIEYGSITCPHCAAFSAASGEALKNNYVKSGKVSYEFRSYLLHGQDLMATALVQCGGPEPFFSILDATYAAQQDWIGKLMALPQAEAQRLQSLPLAAQTTALAQASGLDQFVAARGVSKEAIAQCLADPRLGDKLIKLRDDGNKTYNITGTPTFIINGKTVENVADWKLLEPELRAAGA